MTDKNPRFIRPVDVVAQAAADARLDGPNTHIPTTTDVGHGPPHTAMRQIARALGRLEAREHLQSQTNRDNAVNTDVPPFEHSPKERL